MERVGAAEGFRDVETQAVDLHDTGVGFERHPLDLDTFAPDGLFEIRAAWRKRLSPKG